jgi:hypothetical protein
LARTRPSISKQDIFDLNPALSARLLAGCQITSASARLWRSQALQCRVGLSEGPLASSDHCNGYAQTIRRCDRSHGSEPKHPEDDAIDDNLILVWGGKRRIITGADLLGRFLRGSAAQEANEN